MVCVVVVVVVVVVRIASSSLNSVTVRGFCSIRTIETPAGPILSSALI
jgi:hypothetical protein